jgi:hypothetical protein
MSDEENLLVRGIIDTVPVCISIIRPVNGHKLDSLRDLHTITKDATCGNF